MPVFISSLRWTGWRRSILPLGPQTKLRRVLSRAGIRTADEACEDTLNALPPSAPPQLIEPGARQPLVIPLPVTPARVAVIGGRFSMARNIRQFNIGDIGALMGWRPDALVAQLDQALAIAEISPVKLEGTASISTALIVLTSVGASCGPVGSSAQVPDERQRERLWRAFGVPIFEQLQAWDESVIARECEVHDGLHISENAAIMHRDQDGEVLLTLLDSKVPVLKARTGLRADIVRQECECGSESPRLLGIEAIADAKVEEAA